LPGFAFSSALRSADNYLVTAATTLDKLMTSVLGYQKYAVHGNGMGMYVAFAMYDALNTTVRAGHFPLLPFFSTTADELRLRGIALSPQEEFLHKRSMEWTDTGSAYYLEQIYQPNTISAALYDSPMGQLAWSGEKWLSCMMPFLVSILYQAVLILP